MRTNKILLSAMFSVLCLVSGGQSDAEPPPTNAPAAQQTKTCQDQVGPDGKSYTEWCQKNVVGKPKTATISCFGPASIQLRCMKSCALCQ